MKSIPRKLPRRLLACALSVAFAAVPIGGSANHSWGGYHWARTANPFTLQLGDNVTSAWDSYLRTTSSDWTASSVVDTTIVDPGGVSNLKRCPATSGRVEVCNTTYGRTGWLGVAQIWVSGLHILQGTVKVNDTYFNTKKYNTPPWRNLVMCQEVGHTLGLDHQDETFDNPNLGTCMDYTNDPDGKIQGQLSNEHPNQHDYDELVTIYSQLDSMAIVTDAKNASNMPAAMTEYDYAQRIQWGKLVRSSKDGLLETYSLDFGRGFKLLTFVIWAEGEGRGR